MNEESSVPYSSVNDTGHRFLQDHNNENSHNSNRLLFDERSGPGSGTLVVPTETD